MVSIPKKGGDMKHEKNFFGYVIVYWAMLLLSLIVAGIMMLLLGIMGLQPPILVAGLGLAVLCLPPFISAGRFLQIEDRLPERKENVLISLCAFGLPAFFIFVFMFVGIMTAEDSAAATPIAMGGGFAMILIYLSLIVNFGILAKFRFIRDLGDLDVEPLT